jgi:phenylpropionate dioxygenase-like ring-hydroxylating dioxygenase large terminal subunit
MNVEAMRGRTAAQCAVVPAEHYVSAEFLEREIQALWPKIWQMACREEEIPKVGDYYTYDIVDESIVVVRSKPDEIKAFYNACPHRGRNITEGCGHTARLFCRYHGWQWDLSGQIAKVIDREDWDGALTDADVNLVEVKVGRWSGWVYVNMDPDSVSLEEHLAPAKAFLDPFELHEMRYYWRKSTILPCNWKTALEAFNEGYHVQQTHSQMLQYMDDITRSYAHGRHAHFGYWEALPSGSRSRRLTDDQPTEDIRPGLLNYMEDMAATLNSGSSVNSVHAARRVMQEVPPGTPIPEVQMKFGQFIHEHLTANGVTFPPITPEQMHVAGIDWHLFPNQIMLQAPTGLLGYRARPNGRDPDSCIWDVYTLQRYAPGQEPKVEHEWSLDITDVGFWGKILTQDFENMAAVQRGMKSRGFKGARPNPLQETAISNFHRALADFLVDGY